MQAYTVHRGIKNVGWVTGFYVGLFRSAACLFLTLFLVKTLLNKALVIMNPLVYSTGQHAWPI